MTQDRIILGIDPGTRVTGYGLVKVSGRQTVALDYGCIRPPAALKLSERYHILFNAVEALLDKHRPQVLAVETQFYSSKTSVQSMIKLGMARGVAMLAATRQEIAIYGYAPCKVKKAVVGKGSASKSQVQSMVQWLLELTAIPEPADAADALALALCHAFNENSGYQDLTHWEI